MRYCAPLAHTFWTDSADEGGHVEFPSEEGEIVGLEAMNEAVYVFRERGIVRLDARGAAREFSAQAVPYGGGKIFRRLDRGLRGKNLFSDRGRGVRLRRKDLAKDRRSVAAFVADGQAGMRTRRV